MRTPARLTNTALLAALVIAFGTGVGAVAIGSAHGRWVVLGHGAAGVLLVLLIPAKSRIARYSAHRARPSRWASYSLAVLVLATIVLGFGYATGLVRSVLGIPGMWLHVAVALVLIPLLVWHIVARRTRLRARKYQSWSLADSATSGSSKSMAR